MKSSPNRYITIAFVLLALAVAFGAIGAHLLEKHLADRDIEIYRKANFYHFIHAIGLLLLGAYNRRMSTKALNTSSFFMVVGILFFSGSLYTIALSTLFFETRWDFLGMLAPIGGLSFISGWLWPLFNLRKKHYSTETKHETE